MKKSFLTLTLVLLAAICALGETTFQVVPPRNVIAGNRFMVTYRLTNGQGEKINAPKIEGCKLMSPNPGVSTMQSYQNVNGNVTNTTTVDYSFTYRAEKEGTYTVPPASIVSGGKTYTSRSVQFKVLPPDQAPQRGSQSSAPGGFFDDDYDDVRVDDLRSQDADKPISKNDIFVRIILNKSHVYEQEALECTIKLYTKYQRINSFMMKTPPTFDGFLIDEIDTQAQLNEVEHYNGQNYITAVLKHCIIFPQKSGKLTIHSGTYELSVVQVERVSNGWFYSAVPVEKSVNLQPYTSTVTVSPLPEPRPEGFNGAVGVFQFESKMSDTQLRTGEAASLKYIITGTGNIKYVKEPKPELPDEFEQYTPKVDSRTRVVGNNVAGTETVDYTIVPQSVGQFTIPAMDFVYFNPQTGKYVTLPSPAYHLTVAKGSGVTSSGEQTDIQIKNTDILHIKTGPKNLQKEHLPLARFWWYWGVFGVLIVVLIVAVLTNSRRARLNADTVGRAAARANKVAKKRLKLAEKFMRSHQPDKFYEELLRAMWGFLSDKLAIPASQLTRQNITETLASKGVDKALAQQVIAVLDACEMARYTPDSSSDASVDALYRDAVSAIDAMERVKISRR